MIRFAKLNIAIELAPLQKELAELINLNWKPHYNSKHYTGDWNVLALRAPNGNIDSPFAELMDGGSFLDTEFMKLCPEIKKTIDTFQCEKTAIRLLNLKKRV